MNMIDSLGLSNKLRRGVKLVCSKLDEKNMEIRTPRFDPETGERQEEASHVRLQHLVDKKTQLTRELAACEELIKEAQKLGLVIPSSSI